jgi:hypothetical protein
MTILLIATQDDFLRMRRNHRTKPTYDNHIWHGFSQLARYFVTNGVDSNGLKWTQLDRLGLVRGHNLDIVVGEESTALILMALAI